MEHIINPRTGRLIMVNGFVWKSLSVEERNEGQRLVLLRRRRVLIRKKKLNHPKLNMYNRFINY